MRRRSPSSTRTDAPVTYTTRFRSLLWHAAGHALDVGILEARGIHRGEFEIADARRALAAVAGHARRIVDDGEPAAHQAIEQGRLADVGPADYGDLGGHGFRFVSDRRSASRHR